MILRLLALLGSLASAQEAPAGIEASSAPVAGVEASSATIGKIEFQDARL